MLDILRSNICPITVHQPNMSKTECVYITVFAVKSNLGQFLVPKNKDDQVLVNQAIGYILNSETS